MAQAPIAAMSSTSAYGIQTTSHNHETKAIANDVAVRGIYTSASAIQGGVTTYDTGSRNVLGRRKTEIVPGKPGECHCVDSNGDGYCDHCDAEIDEFDGGCSNDPCWCPLDFNGAAALFMTALAVAYAIYKKRTCTLQ